MQPRDLVAGRFEIDRLAGTGGMGAVYRAVDRQTGQPVALKVLHGHGADHTDRFAREAQLLSELRHPGIVRFVGSGVTDRNEGFIVMEWLDGESLADRLRRGPLSVPEVVTLGARIAAALRPAHDRGIVHRDLKPQNLFLERGAIENVKVLDFGIARILDPGQKLTVTGAMLGTPGYMSPEQVRGGSQVDTRTDVYALGCVIFRCVTGRPVFEGDDAVSTLLKVASEPAPRATTVRGDVPPALDDLLARMLDMSPAARPRDAAAVLTELAALGGLSAGATAVGGPPPGVPLAPGPTSGIAHPSVASLPTAAPAGLSSQSWQAPGTFTPAPPPGGGMLPPGAGPPGWSAQGGPPPAGAYAPGPYAPAPYPAGYMPAVPQTPTQGGGKASAMLLAAAAGGLLVLVLVLGGVLWLFTSRGSTTSSTPTTPVGAPAGFCPGEKCVSHAIGNASRVDAITILPDVRDVARDVDPTADLIMLIVSTMNDDGTVDLTNPKSFLHYHFQPPQKVGRFYVWVQASQMVISHTPSQALTQLPMRDPVCNATAAFRAALPRGRPLPDNPTMMQLIDVGPPVGWMWNITTEGASAIVDPRTCAIKR